MDFAVDLKKNHRGALVFGTDFFSNVMIFVFVFFSIEFWLGCDLRFFCVKLVRLLWLRIEVNAAAVRFSFAFLGLVLMSSRCRFVWAMQLMGFSFRVFYLKYGSISLWVFFREMREPYLRACSASPVLWFGLLRLEQAIFNALIVDCECVWFVSALKNMRFFLLFFCGRICAWQVLLLASSALWYRLMPTSLGASVLPPASELCVTFFVPKFMPTRLD